MTNRFAAIFLAFYLSLTIITILDSCAPNSKTSSPLLKQNQFKSNNSYAQIVNAGHSMKITASAISPNGRLLITGSNDRIIKLWEVSTGREIQTISSATHFPTAFVFSSDSRYFYVGFHNGSVSKWDTISGKEVWSFLPEKRFIMNPAWSKEYYEAISETGRIESLSESPDGKFLIVGSRVLILRNAASGERVKVLKNHANLVYSYNKRGFYNAISCLEIAPNGKYAISGTDGGSIVRWELPTGKMLSALHRPSFNASASFSNLVLHISYSDLEGETVILLLSKSNNKILSTFKVDKLFRENIRYYSDDRKFYFVNKEYGEILLVNTRNNKETILKPGWEKSGLGWKNSYSKVFSSEKIFFGGTSRVTSVAISPDSRFVISANKCGVIRIFKLDSMEVTTLFPVNSQIPVFISFLKDSQIARIYYSGGNIKLIEIPSGKLVDEIVTKTNFSNILSITLDGKFGILSEESENIFLRDLISNRNIKTFISNSGNIISSIATSSDSEVAIFGTKNGKIHLWSLRTGKFINSFIGHKKKVTHLNFTNEKKRFLSTSHDDSIVLWDMSTGKKISTINTSNGIINAIAINLTTKQLIYGTNSKLVYNDSRTGKYAGSSAIELTEKIIAFTNDGSLALQHLNDGSISIVDTQNQKTLKKVTISDWVSFGGFSPDKEIFFAGNLNSIHFGKIHEIDKIKTIKHENNFTCATISPDNNYILAGLSDNTLEIWKISSEETIKKFYGHSARINAVSFLSKGERFISGSDDMTARLWDVKSGNELIKMVSSNDGEWITCTPEGYYNTSLEGNNLIHWVFPGTMETFSFALFEKLFKRSDIINSRLKGNFDVGLPAPQITKPPTFEMDDHLSVKHISSKDYTFSIKIPFDSSIKKLRIFINGRAALETPVNDHELEHSITIPLINGSNRVTVLSYDEKGISSNPKYVDVICKDPNLSKPNLYYLGIGVSEYPRLPITWQLDFAHKDAISLQKVFSNHGYRMFKKVETNLLTNSQANIKSIYKRLNNLDDINQNDIAVIFMAGHGIKDRTGTFYFLTSDGNFKEHLEGGLSWQELTKYISRIKGRVIFLLDACHSGSMVSETVVPNDELAKEFFTGKRGGTMVFSASKGRQYSLESPDIGNGAGIFTYAVTQGLTGESKNADVNKNGFVEFMELADYVTEYVNRKTNGEQTPWLSRKEMFGDLPIAKVVH